MLTASEHYKAEKGLPLPAQMFRLGADELLKNTDAFWLSLRSLTLINFASAPLTPAEKEGDFFDTILEWLSPSSETARESEHEEATPGEVSRAVQDLIAEISVLRDELGVFDYPPQAELQEDRTPVHVYAKTLEVLSKVILTQRRFGVPEAQARQIPFKEVHSGNVLANVEYIADEITKIKTQMLIAREIESAPLVGGLSPSFVYKNLADASFLLDGLGGRPLTPNDVYRNCTHILDEMGLIATKLGVSLDLELPEAGEEKRPKEVAQQVLRATYKVINLQTALGMDASGVPSLTLVRVTPSEVFDSTNMLLAEMARIKFHLGVDERRAERPEPTGKRPSDSFALVLGIIKNLDGMSAAARS